MLKMIVHPRISLSNCVLSLLLINSAAWPAFANDASKAAKQADSIQPIAETRITPKNVLERDTPISLSPKMEISVLASTVAKASGQPTLVVLPNKSALWKKLNDASSVHDIPNSVTWNNFQQLLHSAGAAVIRFSDDKVISIVQGSSYRLAKVKPECFFGQAWPLFWNAYQQLAPKDKEALLSNDGLVINGGLSSAPEGFRKLLEREDVQNPESTNGRIRFALRPMLFTAFIDAPKEQLSAWWSWDGEGFFDENIEGEKQQGNTLGFPFSTSINNLEGQPWDDNTLALGTGDVFPNLRSVGCRVFSLFLQPNLR